MEVQEDRKKQAAIEKGQASRKRTKRKLLWPVFWPLLSFASSVCYNARNCNVRVSIKPTGKGLPKSYILVVGVNKHSFTQTMSCWGKLASHQ